MYRDRSLSRRCLFRTTHLSVKLRYVAQAHRGNQSGVRQVLAEPLRAWDRQERGLGATVFTCAKTVIRVSS